MPSCRFFRPGPDSCYGDCGHPEADHEPCIYNSGEDVDCILQEPIMTTMQISRDTLEALREYGYPAEKAVKTLLEMATDSKSS